MIREVDFDVDSNCSMPPVDAEGPTDATCGTDATTFVKAPAGYRRYICPAHADQLDRFDDVRLEDHPRAVVCDACQRLTPYAKMNFDGRCEDCSV